MSTGEKIRLARKQAGLSQEVLGERVGLSGNQIGKYERDQSPVRIDKLQKIADELHVTLAYLAEYETQESLSVAEPPVDPYGGFQVDPALRLLPYVSEWDGTWPLPAKVKRWWVHQKVVVHQECLITSISKDDDSMRPYLLPGDAIVIDPLVKRPRSLAIVMVRIGEQQLIRRFKRTKERRAYTPINPRFPAHLETGREKVLGQVVGLVARRFIEPLTFELGQ